MSSSSEPSQECLPLNNSTIGDDEVYATQPNDVQDRDIYLELKNKLGHKDRQSFVDSLLDIYDNKPTQINHIRESLYNYGKDTCANFPDGHLIKRRQTDGVTVGQLDKYAHDVFHLFHFIEGGLPSHVLQTKVFSRSNIRNLSITSSEVEQEEDTQSRHGNATTNIDKHIACTVESVSYNQGPGDLVSITHDKNVNLTGCSAMVLSLDTCGESYFFLSSVYSNTAPYFTITLPGQGKTKYAISYGSESLGSGSAGISMCGSGQWFWASWENRMITFGLGLQVGEDEILRADTKDVDPITFSGIKTMSEASISVEKSECVPDTTTTTPTTTMISTTTSSANSNLGRIDELSAVEEERPGVVDKDGTGVAGANVTEVDLVNTTDVVQMDSGCSPGGVVSGLLLVTTLAPLM